MNGGGRNEATRHVLNQGILKGEVSMYIDLLFDWFGISCMNTENFFYLQNRLIETSQTGRQWYSDTSPLRISWLNISTLILLTTYFNKFQMKLLLKFSGG
jgi:hypothetical protein